MGRRVSNINTPDSLKVAKEKERQAEAKARSAEKGLSDVTNAITAAETEKGSVEAEIATLESSKESKLAELATIQGQVSDAKDELRGVQGELVTARDEVAVEKAAIAEAKTEHEKTLADMKQAHLDQMASYERTQSEAKGAIDAMAETVKQKKLELEGVEKVIDRFKKEETRLNNEVLPQVTEEKAKLESLNSQVLSKQLELQKAEATHKEMVGKYHDEKVRYEEAHAHRNSEEQRVEELLETLAKKSDEVESKSRSLKTIQEGVDQATARLHRKEEDLKVKEHLFKQREVTQT